jgi:hypothetical protein
VGALAWGQSERGPELRLGERLGRKRLARRRKEQLEPAVSGVDAESLTGSPEPSAECPFRRAATRLSWTRRKRLGQSRQWPRSQRLAWVRTP